MIQAALGLAIGIPVALLCVRFVKTQLYENHQRGRQCDGGRDCDSGGGGMHCRDHSGAARGID